MKFRSTYRGGDQPFEGDRTLLLGGIPSKARILQATATVAPIDATNGLNPFAEIIPLGDGAGLWGTTQVVGSGFIEVDFHARRTLAGVVGDFDGATLQVDMGGIYVDINARGAILVPPTDTPFPVLADGALPGLTVNKFKLTKPSQDPPPPLSAVTIRSVPTNVSLRLGSLPPFWTGLGEQNQSEMTPDFAEILQAFLVDAGIENDFYVVPVVLHSDTIARFEITLEIEYLCQAEVLPEGLNEVTFPFDFGSLPQADAEVLQVSLPANARFVLNESRSRVIGAFEESRVVHGLTGAVAPAAALDVSPVSSQATFISLETSLSVRAIDLLLTTVTRSVRLQLDLREDLDGKPDNISLLPKPVAFTLDRETTGQATWISVPLPNEFQFLDQGKRSYWLVIQSLEGDALWSVETVTLDKPGMQFTRDGGFSWRETSASGVPGGGPLSGFFRLRQQPDRFRMPIALEVGSGKAAKRVQFDRFQPMGRVEFSLDLPEVSEAFNQSLAENTSAPCPEAEHLANGDFEEWLRLGEDVGDPITVDLSDIPLHTPTVVAISPDGAWAYLGSSVTVGSEGSEGVLILVDAVCDKVLGAQVLDSSGQIIALVINTLGSRAYAISEDRLLLIDTSTHRVLGRFVSIEDARALALSPDDRRLYVAEAEEDTIQIFDTQKLEAQVFGAGASSDAEITIKTGDPISLAVSPDGSRLYVAIRKGTDSNGEIKIFDTVTQEPIGSAIPVGKDPIAIALTPDGKLLVVANTGDDTLSLIDTGENVVSGAPISVGSSPIALAIAHDGTRVFVANGDGNDLSVIDLITHKAVAPPIEFGHTAVDVAITPGGGKVYVVGTEPSDHDAPSVGSLASIQIGGRLPTMWTPFGWVRPRCLDDPFQQFAELGNTVVQTSLSQVVPVKAACLYDFSFLGQATETGSVAEVMWLGQDGGLLRMDQSPIETGWLDVGKNFPPNEDPHPVLHQRRLTAPDAAAQAELRFRVSQKVAAVIGKVSFAASTETVVNGDLRLQKALRPEGWTLLPETSPGFSVTISVQGTQLRNAGSGPVTLLQTVQALAEQSFALAFQGRARHLSPVGFTPQIEVHWRMEDGTPAGSPMSIEILPTDFNHHRANGSIPPDTVEAEIRLVVPAKTTLEVERISLRFTASTTVPVTFVAQAPGELTVSDWRVTYDQEQASPPSIPDEGLSFPTPPDHRPGEAPCDLCICACCKTEQTMEAPSPVMTEDGHPAVVGRCPGCNAEMVRFGGQTAVDAVLISIPKEPRRLVFHRSTKAKVHLMIKSSAAAASKVAEMPKMTDIYGISGKRERRLAEIGIDSIAELSEAAPEVVKQGIKNISIELAARFIKEAKRLLAVEEDH